MNARVGLVLVAHTSELARGAATVARQMAPGVRIGAVGGFPVDGVETIGTDVDGVLAEVSVQLGEGLDVVVLGDLGSALLTAGLVLELLEPALSDRVRVPAAPFVEGAVAAAVSAASGAELAAVAAAARGAVGLWDVSAGVDASSDEAGVAHEGASGGGADGESTRRVVLGNSTGLHARPAAVLARLVSGFDAQVTVNEAPAESVFELMKLAADGGAELEVAARGAEAAEALDAVVAAISAGLGER